MFFKLAIRKTYYYLAYYILLNLFKSLYYYKDDKLSGRRAKR